jgi:hypothetical protein
MLQQKKTVYRDSKTGVFITRQKAARKNPATWEKERVPVKAPKR